MTIDDLMLISGIAFGVLLLAPLIVYICVKLGTVAFFRGKEISKEEHRKKLEIKRKNGNGYLPKIHRPKSTDQN